MMNRYVRALCLTSILALALGAVACGPNEEEQAAAAREEAWTELQQHHTALIEKRQSLRDLQQSIAGGVGAIEVNEEGVTEEGLSPEEALERKKQEASALEEEVVTDADEFQAELVNFINEDPMIQGEEPTERQKAALRMKSIEDMELAREYVDKGGDYRRAIDILERAKAIDLGNQELQAYLDEVSALRYVNEERFALVKKDMTQDEVRAILGQVFHRNIREYEEQGAVAWFYPKEEGGAAGVFFRERNGEWKVYQLDYDAVKGQQELSDS